MLAGGWNGTIALASAEIYTSDAASVRVILGNLTQTYDGTAKPVTVTTIPPGLVVDVTYDGSPFAPTNVGTYTLVGTVNDACYQGATTNLLTINPASSNATNTITLTGATTVANGAFQFTFVNTPGAAFSVLATTNPALPAELLDGAWGSRGNRARPIPVHGYPGDE